MDNQQGFFSRKLRAGKRRTYFFDVRSTKQGDYFVTITESKRRFDRPGYDSHKIFLYKEDFTKFSESLAETLNHIKTELNPDFDYDAYDREAYQAQVEEAQGEDGDYEDERTPKKHHQPKEQTEKRNVRPNKDLMSTPIVSSTPKKSIIDDVSDVNPPSDEAMDW